VVKEVWVALGALAVVAAAAVRVPPAQPVLKHREARLAVTDISVVLAVSAAVPVVAELEEPERSVAQAREVASTFTMVTRPCSRPLSWETWLSLAEGARVARVGRAEQEV
jgi:hypothetical protein